MYCKFLSQYDKHKHTHTRNSGDIAQPLDVAQHNGNFCSLSNRRLTALMMYQALHRDSAVKAWCTICSSDTEKFEDANSTQNEGLGVDTREGTSSHFGAPLFERGEYVLHELDALAGRHPSDEGLSELMAKLCVRHSRREVDGCSLTLSHTSGGDARGSAGSGSRRRGRSAW